MGDNCVCLTLKNEPCKGKLKAGEIMCATHRRKPCEKMIFDSQKVTSSSSSTSSTSLASKDTSKSKSRKKQPTTKKSSSKSNKKDPKKEPQEKKRASAQKSPVVKETLKKRKEKKEVIQNQNTTPSEKTTSNKSRQTKNIEISLPVSNQKKITYSVNQSLKNAQLWRNIMNPGYQFPKWVLSFFKANTDIYSDLLKKVKVYVSKITVESLEDLFRLVKEREPVNIARNQQYDKKSLQKNFGWSDGFYDRYFQEHKRLAPNIAIYTPCLFQAENNEFESKSFEVIDLKILNVIGLAFDHKKQSDYQYFFREHTNLDVILNVSLHYMRMFEMIFRCAKDNSIETIMLPPVGLGHFATFFHPSKTKLMDIYIAAMKIALKNNAFLGEMRLMGFDNHDSKNMKTKLMSDVTFGPDVGYFPGNVQLYEGNMQTTLWVNAWDMLSGPGNGCEGDNSLDGWMGRTTTISVTGNGALNPYLQEKDSYVFV